MIDRQEILEFAGEVGLDPNVVEKDYVLGWMLAGIAQHPQTRDTWVFKGGTNQTLEKRLWAAADQFRANSGLKAGQYSTPVLGLILLRFATACFAQPRAQFEKAGTFARQRNDQ